MSEWCDECGGAIETGICLDCGDESNYTEEGESKE